MTKKRSLFLLLIGTLSTGVIFSQNAPQKNSGQLDFFVENDPTNPDYIFLKDSIGRRVRVQLPQELNDAEKYNIQINKKLLDKMFPNEQKIFDEKELLDESLGDIKKEELEKRGLNEAKQDLEIVPEKTPSKADVPPAAKPKPNTPDAVNEEPETEGVGAAPEAAEESPETQEIKKEEEPKKEEPKKEEPKPMQSQPSSGGNPYPYYAAPGGGGGGYPMVTAIVIGGQDGRPAPEPKHEKKSPKEAPKYEGVSSGEDVSMLLYLANVAYYKKNYLRSLELLNRADYIHPYDARIKMMKGSLFYKIGWKDYAIRFWNEALVINPNLRVLYYYVDKARREVESKVKQGANLNSAGDGTESVLGVD